MKPNRTIPAPVTILALALAATLGAMLAWAGIHHLLSRHAGMNPDTAMGIAAAGATLSISLIIALVAQNSRLRRADEPNEPGDPGEPDPAQGQNNPPASTHRPSRESYRDILSGDIPREERPPPPG